MATMVDAGVYSYGTITLPRFNVRVTVAMENDSNVQWFGVREVSQGMGIVQEDEQAAKVNRDYPDAAREVPMKRRNGWRKVLCIKRPELALWIASIQTPRLKPEIREAFDDFKAELMREADKLLFDRKRHHNEPRTTVRIEQHMACLECGTPHLVVYEDGVTTVVREDE